MNAVQSRGDADARPEARYEWIFRTLVDAIASERLKPGVVLLEGPLASVFGTSRVPVRQAFGMLYEREMITRFEGRGFVVCDSLGGLVEPLRIPLTSKLLGLDESEVADTRSTGERVYDDLQVALSTCSVFGHYVLDEATAVEFYGVSRGVIREALMRLRDSGLVEKEPYSSWLAGPLTAREVMDDYQIRAELEPCALKASAKALKPENLQLAIERLNAAAQQPVTLQVLDALEADLHINCLDSCANRKLLSILRHSRAPFVINRIFHLSLSVQPDVAMLNEHRLVFELLLQGGVDAAALSLREHIFKAQGRTLQRLKVMSVLPEPELPPYLMRLS